MDVLDLLAEIKTKCLQNDCDIYESLKLSQAEYQFFMASTKIDKLDTNSISEEMGISLSRLSRVVDKMVKNGYLTRKTSKQDRRAIILGLTQKGKDILAQILESRKKCEQIIESKFKEEELEDITKTLKLLSSAL